MFDRTLGLNSQKLKNVNNFLKNVARNLRKFVLHSLTVLTKHAAYCVVAKESAGKQISIAFLERVKADFKKRYGGGKADTAVAKSLNKEFGYLLFL